MVLFPFPLISAHRKWPEMVVSASTNQLWTKITVRTYAWSFGHSDPDPSGVRRIAIGFFYCYDSLNNPIVWILPCKFCNLGEHFSFKAPNGDLWYLTWLVIGFSVLWFFKQPNWLNSPLAIFSIWVNLFSSRRQN